MQQAQYARSRIRARCLRGGRDSVEVRARSRYGDATIVPEISKRTGEKEAGRDGRCTTRIRHTARYIRCGGVTNIIAIRRVESRCCRASSAMMLMLMLLPLIDANTVIIFAYVISSAGQIAE